MSDTMTKRPTSSLAVTVATNVRIRAAILGLNQSEIARAIGVAPRTVSERWFGRRQWQLEDLDKLAPVLGVEPAELLARSEGFEPPTFWLEVAVAVLGFGSLLAAVGVSR